MQSNRFFLSMAMASLMSAGFVSAHAAQGDSKQGVFYDPSNPASPTGKTTGYELYRTIGCPGRQLLDKECPPEKDSDGDGVVDSQDKCPGTPPGRKVNADGCEIDSDGDGIVDGDDKCPTVYAKTADGCPPPPPAAAPAPAPVAEPAPQPARSAVVPAPMPTPKLVLDDVNFDYNKASLRTEAFGKLDRAVGEIRNWGDGTVEIGGHTDSRGSAEYNMELSLKRAETVKRYLVDKGVPAEKLVVKGYGETQPVADNDTEAGRFQNRRVELQPVK